MSDIAEQQAADELARQRIAAAEQAAADAEAARLARLTAENGSMR